jgi:hypothetical protein
MHAMVLVATVLVASVIAGWLAGGRLRNLGQVRLRWVGLVFVAVGLQFALAGVSAAGGPVHLAARAPGRAGGPPRGGGCGGGGGGRPGRPPAAPAARPAPPPPGGQGQSDER